MKTDQIKKASQILGGPVRVIDFNASTRTTTYALASEAVGYPRNWSITRTAKL
jgi:hypothetical protein